jgi:hypothetical protein
MAALSIRDLSLTEADVVANFFHAWWRPNHIFYRDRELLLWLYRRNPVAQLFSNGLTVRAAFDGESLAGIFAYIPFVLNRFGERKYGCHLSAWWAHPAERRGPGGLVLLHSLQHDIRFDAFVAGMNTPVAERLYERLGWVVRYCLPRWVLPLDGERFGALAACDAPRKGPLRSEERGLSDSVTIRPLSAASQLDARDWDRFYWEQFAPGHIGPAREAGYLRWRYDEIPHFRYEFLVARDKGELCGLLVYRNETVRDRQERILRIVDLVCTPEAAPCLIAEVIEVARKAQVVMIDFFCSHAHFQSILERAGFLDAVDTRAGQYWVPYLFQPLDRERMRLNASWWIRGMNLRDASAQHDFFLTKGDYEFDRPG